MDSQLPLDRSQGHPFAPSSLNRLPPLPRKERRLARKGGFGLAGLGCAAGDGPVDSSLLLPLSPVVREPPSGIRPSRGCQRSGQENVRNARGRFGGIPDWEAPPGQRGRAQHASAIDTGPGNNWGVAAGTSPCLPWPLVNGGGSPGVGPGQADAAADIGPVATEAQNASPTSSTKAWLPADFLVSLSHAPRRQHTTTSRSAIDLDTPQFRCTLTQGS